MNYFCHGREVLDEPYVLAGTAVPDWLGAAARGVRLPPRTAAKWVDSPESTTAALAKGVCRHHADDAWFHVTPAFGRLCAEFREAVEAASKEVEGRIAGLLAHVTVELLLDARLIEQNPSALDRYFDAVATVDPTAVALAVEKMTGRRPDRLAWFIRMFRQEQFLRDYLDDASLSRRLDQVFQRAGFGGIPRGFQSLLPSFRAAVYAGAPELLRPVGNADVEHSP